MVLPLGRDDSVGGTSSPTRYRTRTAAEIFMEQAELEAERKNPSRTEAKLENAVLTPPVVGILVTQCLERFSFSGCQIILILYLHQELGFSELDAISLYSCFTFVSNTSPVFGALLADGRLGCFRTVVWFGTIYAVGMCILSYAAGLIAGNGVDDDGEFHDEQDIKVKRIITSLGLVIFSVGTGGVRPVLSIFGADQVALSDVEERSFPNEQEQGRGQDGKTRAIKISRATILKNKIRAFFVHYYSCINIGAGTAILLVPVLRRYFGFGLAFLVPTWCMFLALWVFVCFQNLYEHRPTNANSPVITTFYLCVWLIHRDLWEYRCFQTCFPFWKPSPVPRYGHHTLISNVDLDNDDYDDDDDDHSASPGLVREDSSGGRGTLKMHRRSVGGSFRKNGSGAADVDEKEAIIREMSQTSMSDPSLVSATHLATLSSRERNILEAELADAKRAVQIMPIMATLPVFWMLYDQQASVWILQATKMDLHGIEPEQLFFLNPMANSLVALTDSFVFPTLARYGFDVSPLRRIGWGMILAALAFLISGILEYAIMFEHDDHGGKLSVFWQLPQYFILAVAENLVRVTGLEFAYSVSPDRLKGFIMAMFLMGIAKGDFWGSVLWSSIFRRMERAVVLFALSVLMLINLIIFGLVVRRWELTHSFKKYRESRTARPRSRLDRDKGPEIFHDEAVDTEDFGRGDII